jgi:hypothetical protein
MEVLPRDAEGLGDLRVQVARTSQHRHEIALVVLPLVLPSALGDADAITKVQNSDGVGGSDPLGVAGVAYKVREMLRVVRGRLGQSAWGRRGGRSIRHQVMTIVLSSDDDKGMPPAESAAAPPAAPVTLGWLGCSVRAVLAEDFKRARERRR